MKSLRFDAERLARRAASPLEVETTLAHFAILTFMVAPEALRGHVHPRFELDTILDGAGSPRALVSVVPFLDLDFRLRRCPWPRWSFGQTNYRAYVSDRETGEHVAWFFGTALDSLSVYVPHLLWRLPWHAARIRFQTRYEPAQRRYLEYRMQSRSRWAPAQLELEDSGEAPQELIGFDDLETGLVLLTHPVTGYYHRRDGRLGSYSIWHERIASTRGHALRASFPLLERLGLVRDGDLSTLHSVLLQPRIDFTIHLPPKRC